MHHQPSPYLKRYRLPQLGFNSPTTSNPYSSNYDELLSPVDDLQAKIELINLKNQQLVRNMPRQYLCTGQALPPSYSFIGETNEGKKCFRMKSGDFNANLRQQRVTSVSPTRLANQPALANSSKRNDQFCTDSVQSKINNASTADTIPQKLNNRTNKKKYNRSKSSKK
uniref:Uncharacterized protein n=1 Tax=Ditylenchus dipsaci TaxID=166011 RepID=A0A915DGQ6_9BILA